VNPGRHLYLLYGLGIESALPLPGAPQVSELDAPPDITVDWEPEATWDPAPWKIVMAASCQDDPDVREAPDGGAVLAWGDALRFVISPGRDRVQVAARAADREFAPVVFVGLVLGYVLHLRRILCLHGSVVERGGRAIAVLGDSGACKSTLSAALVQRGAALLSDDLVVFSRVDEHPLVEPGCASVRLTDTAADQILGPGKALARVPYADKLLWDFSGTLDAPDERYCSRSTPLDAFYCLRDGQSDDELGVGPVSPPLAAVRCLLASWYPPWLRRFLTQERLRALGALASAVPLRVIRYRRTWEQLSRLAEVLCP